MCWSRFLRLFKKNKTPTLVIPHPEEAMNPSATLENTAMNQVINKWFTDWEVPDTQHAFWLGVNIALVENLTVLVSGQSIKVPAATYAEIPRMHIDPKWANPGVLAHELAHIGHYLLSTEEQAAFLTAYNEALGTNALLRLLHSQNAYMKTNSVEAHAEIYRYLGEKTPESLKPYYPHMFAAP